MQHFAERGNNISAERDEYAGHRPLAAQKNWHFFAACRGITWAGNLIHGMLPAPADGFQYGYADPSKGNEGATMSVFTYRNTVTTDPVGTNNFWSTNYAHLAAGQTYTATMAVGNPIGLGTCNYLLTFGAVHANTGYFTLHPHRHSSSTPPWPCPSRVGWR